MKAYQIKPKKGKTFWSVQTEDKDEVIAQAEVTEDFVKTLSEEDKVYMILELAQKIRLDSVEKRLEEEKSRPKGKGRKSIFD